MTQRTTDKASEPPSIFIFGPTASGKSKVALAVAAALRGEIISVDSMQVYRGLDIGTGKPSLADRASIPHHLIDIIDLGGTFSAGDFLRHARTAEKEIRARGKTPVFCGGTGLYFQAYWFGLGDMPKADPEIRRELEKLSTRELQEKLKSTDEVAFEKIDQHNRRRLIRALEVTRISGKPVSGQRPDWAGGRKEIPMKTKGLRFCLMRPRAELRKRIAARIDAMLEAGWLKETAWACEHGLLENPVARQAIGYSQLQEHLLGKRGWVETVELIKLRTCQFAKRQETWFKNQCPDSCAISLEEEEEGAAEAIIERARQLEKGIKKT